MKAIKTYILAIVLFTGVEATSQQVGFDFPPGVDKVNIPFELHSNLIVIPVTLNNSITLKFVFDTGVQYPLLTKKVFGDYLGLEYNRRITVYGPGEKDSIQANIAQNITLSLPGGIESGINQAILVLEEDYLELSNNLGTEVFGVIGYDIFSRFIVEINYDEKIITLKEPKKFKAKRSYKKIPLKVVNTKPYIQLGVSKDSAMVHNMHLMIDTGASHAILLDNSNANNDSLVPEQKVTSVIGRGLGGSINGYLGRMAFVQIGKWQLQQPIATFPVEGDYGASSIKRGSRNGTIGGELLTRFNVIFDYFGGYLYMKRNKMYHRDFEHDMSGLNIAVHGEKLNELMVNDVRLNSPAYNAGLRVGDYIKSINGHTLESVEFADISFILRNRDGKKIIVKFKRGNETIKTSFKLKRYI